MTFRKQYTNLHTHSIGSMLDGHGKPDAYMQRASELGMTGLALTDHGNLHLLMDWYDAGIEHGVKPILGIEAYQARKTRFDKDPEERAGPARDEWDQRGPYHLTVLAKNMAGYKNLIQLSSEAYLEGFYVKPRIDYELLNLHSEGLIVLSGCLNGELQQALLRGDRNAAYASAETMKEIFGDNYFLEIQDHGIAEQSFVNKTLVEMSKELDIPIVPTGDCHYVHQSDHEAHDLMLCVSTKATIDQENRFKFHGPEFHLKSYEEMAKIFEPEWLENSMVICDMVELDLKFGELYFPEALDIPKELTVGEHLEKLVWEGAADRYGTNPPESVTERIEHELGVVSRMGFEEYFLVVYDIINWGKSEGIRFGPGRGSAAGSILSYCLKITNLDPLTYGLLFERFLVEGRKSPPDIDIDIDDRYRDKVIEYVRQRFGADQVAHICTFSSVGAKSAIRDAGRALGYEYAKADQICKMIPPPVLGVMKSIDESLEVSTELATQYENDEITKIIIDAAKGLEGVYRQPGIHAAGVVISRGPVTDYVPVMQKGEDQPVVTQWPMERVERAGLLKIDFLGLRNLGVIDICVENVKKTRGFEIDVDNINLEDRSVYETYCKGNAVGTFQTEGAGMKDMMLSLQPDNIFDIMALISLYRPGPMGSGLDKMFINRKHGREKINSIHPTYDETLTDTYGLMIYQEDVLNVCKNLAGFNAMDADDLRKVIGKKLMKKVAQYREAFVKGCMEHSGTTAETANNIYSQIEFFAGYGFGQAHAASYSLISYITAYLKVHYPAEYMAALMTTVAGKKDKLSVYLNECRKMNIPVLPPSIIRSERDFYVDEDESILFGLSAIDGIGDAIITAILTSRNDNVENIYEYFRDVDSTVLNKATLEHLARSGALDELVQWCSDDLTNEDKNALLEQERQELGIYVTDHPLLGVWKFIEDKVTCDIASLEVIPSGQQVVLGGLLSKVEKRMTKKGQRMFKLTFEDMTGDIEVVVFPREALKLSDDPFKEGDICLLSGSLSKEITDIMGTDETHISYKVFFNGVEKIDSSLLSGTEPIVLRTSRVLSIGELEQLNDIIRSRAGESIVFLQTVDADKTVTTKFKTRTKPEVKELLEQIIAIRSAEINVNKNF